MVSFSRAATFLPAADGTPTVLLMMGSSTYSTKNPPQPDAPGADQPLSTSLLPFSWTICASSWNSASPPNPRIGAVPAGGVVSPAFRFQMIGELDEPM